MATVPYLSLKSAGFPTHLIFSSTIYFLRLFFHQELMGNGSLSEEAMIELMKQQLGKQSHWLKLLYCTPGAADAITDL